MKRHLAAILAADIVGYSRMMAEDESGTLAALKSCVTEVIEPAVGQHTGRIFKTMGDGFLVEFASIVEAVACAGAIQRGMAARNLRPGVLAMQLRIGVHLGDVIAEGEDVFGGRGLRGGDSAWNGRAKPASRRSGDAAAHWRAPRRRNRRG